MSYFSLSPYSPPNLVQRKGEIIKAKFWPLNLHLQKPKSLKFLLNMQLLPEEKYSSWGKEGEKRKAKQSDISIYETNKFTLHHTTKMGRKFRISALIANVTHSKKRMRPGHLYLVIFSYHKCIRLTAKYLAASSRIVQTRSWFLQLASATSVWTFPYRLLKVI